MEILKITSRSASFELSSDNPYYNEKEYDVYLMVNIFLLKIEMFLQFSI